MQVRKKSIIILILVFLPLIILVYVISHTVLLGSFLRLETYNVNQNISRIRQALNAEIDFMSTKISDWANWDDAYDFIIDKNPEFIKSNINELTFAGLKINFIVFLNSSGDVVLARGYDLNTKKELAVPESLFKQKMPVRVSGVLVMGNQQMPVLMAAQNILDSKGQGPARGTLIFASYLNDRVIENISKISGLSLKAKQFSDQSLPQDFLIARNNMFTKSPNFIRPLNDDYIFGYMLVNDIHNKPALIFRADTARDVYKKGLKIILYFTVVLAGLSLFFGLVAVLLLDKLILSRITILSESVAGIGNTQVTSLRLSSSGNDEISRLGQEINIMLGKLDNSKIKLSESENRYHSLVDNVNSIVLSMDNNCRVTFWNKFAVKFFGYSEKEIMGCSVIGTIVPETETGGRSLDKLMKELCVNPQDYSSSINENIKKDGQRVWIVWTNRPIINDKGEQVGVLCVGNDITEFQRMENSLKSLNKAFISLGADFERNISFLTSTCGELLGATYALYNRLSEGIICSVGKWQVPQNYKSIDRPEGHICYDVIRRNQKEIYVVRHLDQTPFAAKDPNVLAYGLKTYVGYPVYAFGECVGSLCVVYQKDVEFSDSDKRIIEILSTAIGIEEERRVSEEALKRSRDFYLALFDRFPTPVWRAGNDGRFDYFNKAWLNFTGRNIDQEIGQGWLENVHPDDRQACIKVYLDAFNERKSFEREFRLRRYDGQYRRIIDVGTPFFDLKSNFAGYIGSCYDITERKHPHH